MITFISGWGTTSQCCTPLFKQLGLSMQTIEWHQLLDSDELLKNTSVCIGWSIGGMMALKAAQKYQFETCILISTTPRQLEDHDFIGVPLKAAKGLEQALQVSPKEALKQFCAMNLHPHREHLETLYEQALSIPQELLLKGLLFLEHTDLRKELAQINSRSLVLHGTQDAITPFACGEYLSSHLPHAQLISIEGAGHALPVTHAQEIASHIREFLSGT